MKKKIIIVVVILGVLGLTTFAIVWFAPQSSIGKAIMNVEKHFEPKAQKPEDAKGLLQVDAAAMAKEYATDEKAADAKYLSKPTEVTGTISETEKNQDGGMMIVLATGDPSLGVQCSMRDKNVTAAKGEKITLIGTCTGNGITGVSMTDCVKNTSAFWREPTAFWSLQISAIRAYIQLKLGLTPMDHGKRQAACEA